MDADHGDLDQVGGRTLQRRVGGGALGEGAQVEILLVDLRDVPAPAEECLHVAVLPGQPHLQIKIRAHAREALEVLRDERLGLFLGDAELPGERERALAVDGPEVDRLGARAHLRRHLRERHIEDERRGLPVDVPTRAEGMDERRIAGEVRHQPQFDLGVVRHDEPATRPRARNPLRISSPRGERTGMFCRFGSEEHSRPVAAPV